MGALRLMAVLFASLPIFFGSQPASAVPVNGLFQNGQPCDNPGTQALTHELGDAAPGGGGFPISEGPAVGAMSTTMGACVADAGVQSSWLVDITNLSNQSYVNLYFVADATLSGAITLGNADGTIVDLSNAAVPPGNAFRIDGTVTIGINNNLLSETGIADEIFTPGETWRFLVTNFGASGAPLLGSIGVFGGTSGIDPASNASILATVVPEPSTILLVLLGLVGMALEKRR